MVESADTFAALTTVFGAKGLLVLATCAVSEFDIHFALFCVSLLGRLVVRCGDRVCWHMQLLRSLLVDLRFTTGVRVSEQRGDTLGFEPVHLDRKGLPTNLSLSILDERFVARGHGLRHQVHFKLRLVCIQRLLK